MSRTERGSVVGWWTAVRVTRAQRVGAFLAFFLILGAGVTLWWIAKLDGPGTVLDRAGAVTAGLGLTVVATLANVSLRWVRWHYLVRSVGARPTAKDSLLIYLVTLPAILTPFYVGELLRAPLVGRLHPRYRTDIVYIWLLERFSDFVVLSLFAAATGRFRTHVIVFALIWIGVVLAMRFRFRVKRLRSWPRISVVAVVLVSSALAWSLVGVALLGTLEMMDSPLGFTDSLGIFGYTTVLGSITGVPVGIGVAGSLLVGQLTLEGVPLSSAIIATVVFRLGTVWFIFAVGSIAVLFKGKRLLDRLRRQGGADHFDDIAETYEDRIPEHVRQRLLVRKVQYMRKALPTTASDGAQRGLDIGCGHGWYACEMARSGYQMDAVDQSSSQVEMARRYAQTQNVECRFLRADAAQLPFDDGTFDFVYAINVLHHVVDYDAQVQALKEIVRVLKPGGVFFLQEVNTMNPLFRFYLGYVFPLIRGIDEGNERWIRPDQLPDLPGARWVQDKLYFTFLPDFIPGLLLKPLSGLERYLEKSRLRKGSAHYVARLIKQAR